MADHPIGFRKHYLPLIGEGGVVTETDHHLLAAPVIDPADEKLAEGLRAILAERDGRELCGYTPWAFTNRLDRKR